MASLQSGAPRIPAQQRHVTGAGGREPAPARRACPEGVMTASNGPSPRLAPGDLRAIERDVARRHGYTRPYALGQSVGSCPGTAEYGHGLSRTTVHGATCCSRWGELIAEALAAAIPAPASEGNSPALVTATDAPGRRAGVTGTQNIELNGGQRTEIMPLPGDLPQAALDVVRALRRTGRDDQALAPTGLALILDALDVAAEHKRGLAEVCEGCPAGGGRCGTCEHRLAAATAYDECAAGLRATLGAAGQDTASP